MRQQTCCNRQSLPSHVTQRDSQAATGGSTDTTLILPLDEVERRAIVHTLKVTGGNISEAARALGIGRNTLYRKMEEHNLLAVKMLFSIWNTVLILETLHAGTCCYQRLPQRYTLPNCVPFWNTSTKNNFKRSR